MAAQLVDDRRLAVAGDRVELPSASSAAQIGLLLEQIGGRRELSPRHSLVLVVLEPEGLSGEELASEMYGASAKAVTIRRHVAAVTPARLPADRPPVRLLADIDADFLESERLVRGGLLDATPATVADRC